MAQEPPSLCPRVSSNEFSGARIQKPAGVPGCYYRMETREPWNRYRDCVRLGTEGPTNHFQGAPSWHSENIMATGTGTHLVRALGSPWG